ncbi:MAG TPA: hypothetical protein VG889_17660 [Rhizomicrobium sp.]|nr:hypothetical protein [Rhizomicrobium sp.]
MKRLNAGRLAMAALLCATLNADAASLRENKFLFSVPNLNQDFHFALKQYELTPGQPWGGVSTTIDTAKHYAWLTVMAGRKNSYDVGYWFRAQIGAGAALGANAEARLPQDLNFAIRGDMDIEAGGTRVLCRDVVIGQGHQTYTGFNNWWVGGPNMTLETDQQGRKLLKQQCEGGTIRTAVGGVGVNNFDLYVGGP